MKIAFFCENDYGKIVGEELIIRGYNVTFNELYSDTELVFVLGSMSAYKFNAYLQKQYELDRFIYKGNIAPIVFDIPTWRFQDIEWAKYYHIYRKMLETWGNCLSISQFTSDQLDTLWNIKSIPLFSVFNDKLIDKYKITVPRKKQIIMVSRFEPHKRFDIVMRAIQDTDWKLIMCGRGGTHTTFYKNLADSLNIDYELHNSPDTEFIVKQYCESQVCVHASVFEGLSLVPKEALWCNTPVILSDTQIHKEFHQDYVNYFKADDIVDLKKVLKNELKLANIEHLQPLTINNVTTNVEKWIKTYF
jgi:glycosyltransferase involved in cell wall biosynthesis